MSSHTLFGRNTRGLGCPRRSGHPRHGVMPAGHLEEQAAIRRAHCVSQLVDGVVDARPFIGRQGLGIGQAHDLITGLSCWFGTRATMVHDRHATGDASLAIGHMS